MMHITVLYLMLIFMASTNVADAVMRDLVQDDDNSYTEPSNEMAFGETFDAMTKKHHLHPNGKPQNNGHKPQNTSSLSAFVDEPMKDLYPLSEKFALNRSTKIDRLTFTRIHNQAHDGSLDSCYFLGLIYVYGLGMSKPDYHEALTWFKEAAMKGHTEAQSALGILLYNGVGSIGQDKRTAMRWFYRASVDSKDVYSYWLLGRSLYEGLTFEDIYITAKDAASALKIDICGGTDDDKGVSFSLLLAAHLFTMAVGVHEAKHHLAIMFEYGLIPYDFSEHCSAQQKKSTQVRDMLFPNYKRAADLYQSAAREGSVESLYNLGLMHSYGRGVPINYSKAADLFRRAALSNHSPSMQYLGLFAMRGLGQTDEMPDFKEAIFWFQKCAEYAPPMVRETCDLELSNIQNAMEQIKLSYYSLRQELLQ